MIIAEKFVINIQIADLTRTSTTTTTHQIAIRIDLTRTRPSTTAAVRTSLQTTKNQTGANLETTALHRPAAMTIVINETTVHQHPRSTFAKILGPGLALDPRIADAPDLLVVVHR